MKIGMKEQENAYLTLFLSLIFGIVMSLVLALVQGAALSATRAQAELVADLGMDSIFAEYNQEVLKQYELFFIDSSYGQAEGGIGKIEKHLQDYIEYNIHPELTLSGKTYLKLANPYLEIEQASIASDNKGEVWKAQAIGYMKDYVGISLIDEVRNHVNIVKGKSLDSIDVEAEVNEKINEFEESLKAKEIVEVSQETENGISYSKIKNAVNSLSGAGIVMFALPKGKSMSGKKIDSNNYFSNRKSILKGMGRHPGVDSADGFENKLIYNEYLMIMCGNYLNKKDNSALDYELEYILYGEDNDRQNLYCTVKKILDIRAAENFIYLITSDSKRQSEAETIATIICSLLTVPELSDLLKYIILGGWAIAEAVVDVRGLLNGKKVPLLKAEGKWKVSLLEFLTGTYLIGDLGFGGDASDNGLDYEDYLRILLAVGSENDISVRSLDIVEMDIRKTDGNKNFRIDRCVDYLKVGFGFENANGHEWVFKKEMCYEPN